jgi:hypothetical protein
VAQSVLEVEVELVVSAQMSWVRILVAVVVPKQHYKHLLQQTILSQLVLVVLGATLVS